MTEMKTLPVELIPFAQAKLEAETRKLIAEAAEAEATAEYEYLRLAEGKRLEAERAALEVSNRVYHFDQAVGSASTTNCQRTLAMWSRLHPGADLEIVFNSPGGSVFDGMALFDYIVKLRADGHHVTTTCRGMAASMAGILLQAGTTRRIGAESYVLIHEISTLAAGKIGELKDEVAFIERISERVIDIFVSRSGGKLTRQKIKRNWNKTDWWLSSSEALELGVVDEVA